MILYLYFYIYLIKFKKLMSESNDIKAQRKKKFLEKMSNKNQNQSQKNISSNPQNNIPQYPPNQYQNNLNQNQYFTNQNNFFNQSPQEQNMNKKNYKGIDYEEKYKKLNIYQSNIQLINKFKKLLLIIISLCHCAKIDLIANAKSFVTTFLIIEITCYGYQIILNQKRRKLIPRENNIQNNNQNSNNKFINNVDKYTDFALNNFGYVDKGFEIFQIVYGLVFDFCLIIMLNIIIISIK